MQLLLMSCFSLKHLFSLASQASKYTRDVKTIERSPIIINSHRIGCCTC